MKNGRKLTSTEKKAITRLSNSKINPDDYLVEKVIQVDKNNRKLQVRHRETNELFEVTIPV